jgi:hypothetical protein
MLYRIITEDKGIPKLRLEIEQAVSKYFDGFTVIDSAIGFWRGDRENSVIFEISNEDSTDVSKRIHKVASLIKEINKQEAVLVQCIPCVMELV